MKKHIFKYLILILCVFTGINTYAYDFKVDGIEYNISSSTDKTVSVVSCSDHGSIVVIPKNVTYKDTTYSVTSIGNSAFAKCTGLTSITIPNSVINIGSSAFYNCTGLTEVIIGKSVKRIGVSAFGGNYRLSKIYSLNPVPPTCANKNVFSDVNKDKCALYVPSGTAEEYKLTYVWWDFNNIVEKDLSGVQETLIDDDANAEYYNLQGKKVDNPSKGIFIMRQGGKTTKIVRN